MSSDSTLVALLGAPPAGYVKSIYYELAPSSAAFPYVVFQKQAGTPTYTMKAGTAPYPFTADTAIRFDGYADELWLLKGVDRAQSADSAERIAGRLAWLFTDGPALSISGASQMYLRRDSDVNYSEVADGVEYKHAGATYRLLYQTP
jgi:hypothetical protein